MGPYKGHRAVSPVTTQPRFIDVRFTRKFICSPFYATHNQGMKKNIPTGKVD